LSKASATVALRRLGCCYLLDVNLRRVSEIIGRERTWKLVSTLTGMLGAMVAQRLIRAVYRAIRKEEPASAFDPHSARFSWSNVVLWAAAAGIGLGIAKVMSARVAAIGWEVATGTLPPGVAEEQGRA
jgi:hypothetical protein